MIVENIMRPNSIDDVEMNCQQEEQFYYCMEYEDNIEQYLELIQYLLIEKRKEHPGTAEEESNMSQSKSVEDDLVITQETVKNKTEDNDLETLVIEPMRRLNQKQVTKVVLENYQAKYGSNHNAPIVTLLPQRKNLQSRNTITKSNHLERQHDILQKLN
jgi:hypothetical protein